MTYSWTNPSTGQWTLDAPDARQLEVRYVDSREGRKWLWRCTAGKGCAELCGWAKNFDLAKVRVLLAWRDTASPDAWAELTFGTIQHLVKKDPSYV